jgi:hypothetical protein
LLTFSFPVPCTRTVATCEAIAPQTCIVVSIPTTEVYYWGGPFQESSFQTEYSNLLRAGGDFDIDGLDSLATLTIPDPQPSTSSNTTTTNTTQTEDLPGGSDSNGDVNGDGSGTDSSVGNGTSVSAATGADDRTVDTSGNDLPAGPSVAIAAAALLFLLVIIFFVSRQRHQNRVNTDGLLKHRQFTDDEEDDVDDQPPVHHNDNNSNIFNDDNQQVMTPARTRNIEIDNEFDPNNVAANSSNRGSNASYMMRSTNGITTGSLQNMEDESVELDIGPTQLAHVINDRDDDSRQSRGTQALYASYTHQGLDHDSIRNHKCSSPHCRICEYKRSAGVSFVPTSSPNRSITSTSMSQASNATRRSYHVDNTVHL